MYCNRKSVITVVHTVSHSNDLFHFLGCSVALKQVGRVSDDRFIFHKAIHSVLILPDFTICMSTDEAVYFFQSKIEPTPQLVHKRGRQVLPPLTPTMVSINVRICMYIYVCTYMYVHICMYVYVCTYMYVRICMYVYVCTYMYVRICMYIYVCRYMYVCICMYVYVCTYMYVHICTYVYVCTYMYVRVCICMYVYVCTYMYVRTPGLSPQ